MPWWCRNLNPGEGEGPCCASEDLGAPVRTPASTEALRPGGELGCVSLEG